MDTAVVKAAVEAGHPARCTQPGCGALLKPDIVFFGEALPSRFWTLSMEDFPACDLLVRSCFVPVRATTLPCEVVRVVSLSANVGAALRAVRACAHAL